MRTGALYGPGRRPDVGAARRRHAGGAYHTHSTALHDLDFNVNPLTRGEARNYAYSAAAEGYQWAGGCWNDNNYDDSPW